MKNCVCYDKSGKMLGWFSRSVAVVAVILLKEGDQCYALVSQRGPETPDVEFRGKWNLCCGYLDFNETAKEAVIRETFEETGVDITSEICELITINSDPKKDKRQNVTLRFGVLLKENRAFYEKQFSHKNNEFGEVGEIKFINLNDLDKYEWAFDHDKIIKDFNGLGDVQLL